MTFTKLFTTLTLATTLATACSPAEVEPTAGRQEKLGGFAPSNSAQAFGGNINGEVIRGIFYSASPPKGQSSPTGWWVRSASTDYYAPVTSMTYGGSAATNISTTQGWMTVTTTGAPQTLNAGAGSKKLTLTVGAPLNATLRIGSPTDGDDYGKYVAEWQPTGGSTWTPFCPHAYDTTDANTDGAVINLTEYMVPVGGSVWYVNGSRANSAQSIQLSCTHDSVGGCVTWGYSPWVSGMQDTHQACTRMKRGDFCGTGDPTTTVYSSEFMHTHIQVADSKPLHTMTGQTTASMEAFWNENGAVCFNQDRFRSTNPTAMERVAITVAANCPNIPACDADSSGLTASAPVCQQPDGSLGACPM